MSKALLTTFILTSSLIATGQDTWIQRDSVKGSGRSSAVGFALNDDAYFLTGLDQFGFKRSMVSYDLSQDDWDDELAMGGLAGDGLNRGSAVAFAVGGLGFCGLGTGSAEYFKDIWKFDPVANIWTQVADFQGTARREAAAFTVGEFAYVGTGQDASGLTNDFWKYDYTLNEWTPIASFPGTPRRDVVAISMGGQGYIGTGIDATSYQSDFWAYYPLTDSWVQKADFPGTPRHGSAGFGLFPRAYLVGGEDNTFTYKKDTWEYNYFSDSWTQRSNFPGVGRAQAIGIVVEGRAFVGTGYSGVLHDDFYEYTPPLLSTDEINQSAGKLYPNPSVGEIAIETISEFDLNQFKVYNELGQDVTIHFEIIKESQLKWKLIAPDAYYGTYFLSLTKPDENLNYNLRFVLL